MDIRNVTLRNECFCMDIRNVFTLRNECFCMDIRNVFTLRNE